MERSTAIYTVEKFERIMSLRCWVVNDGRPLDGLNNMDGAFQQLSL